MYAYTVHPTQFTTMSGYGAGLSSPGTPSFCWAVTAVMLEPNMALPIAMLFVGVERSVVTEDGGGGNGVSELAIADSRSTDG